MLSEDHVKSYLKSGLNRCGSFVKWGALRCRSRNFPALR
jgi:hypothetical protein